MTMSSPATEREVTDTDILKESYRTTGRYSDRYKALMQDSPPRENSTTTKVTVSPARLDYLLKEAQEKKDEKKVSNWQRRLSDKVDIAIEQLRPTATTSTTSVTSTTSTTIGETRKEKKEVPRYMQSTRSYEGRVQTKRGDPLGVRAGGISKRVGTAKVPHFKSTTDINAIEEIRSEMAPDDVYIPMAARIKLFERGLGNGANKPVPTTSTSSTKSNHYQQHQQQQQQQQQRHHHHYTNSNSNTTTTTNNTTNKRKEQQQLPIKRSNYLNSNKQAEESTSIEQKPIIRKKSTELKPATTIRKTANVEVKPFKFATSERALHYKQVFEDRLKLWKVKDVEHQQNERMRELKKRSSTSLSNDKNKVRRMH